MKAKTPPQPSKMSEQTETGTANLLRDQLIKIFNLPVDASEQDIAAAAACAQEFNVTIKAELAQQAAEEVLIAAKTEAGLTRDQAVAVIKRQREHDARLKSDQDARRPRLLEIIKASAPDLRLARALIREEFQFMDGMEFQAAVTAFAESEK